MLELQDVHAGYGKSAVLLGMSLSVGRGEAVAVVGRNGVGKTTTLRTIMGLNRATRGRIVFEGRDIGKLPAHRIPGLGIGYVPQGRRLFPDLTVLENLCIGLRTTLDEALLDSVFARFPRLRERSSQRAGTLSGGEQQMLAIGRCLMMRPRIILFDEPTEGIMPKLVTQIRREIRATHESGVSVLLVEQNLNTALTLCDRVVVVEKGRVCFVGTSAALRASPEVVQRYLGVSV